MVLYFPRSSRLLSHGVVLATILCSCIALRGQTTISDIVYLADGKTFAGSVHISCDAPGASEIKAQNVLNGNLSISLSPTSAVCGAHNYAVSYVSSGAPTILEDWFVPVTTATLRLRDVRVVALSSLIAPSPNTQPRIADIKGLPDTLSQLPLKSTSYIASRAVVTDATGALAGAAGNSSDCLKVDGTSAPCGSGGGGSIQSTDGSLTIISGNASVNTAQIQSLANEQAGSTNYAASASGNPSNYTASLMPSLPVYATGMRIWWRPDVNCVAGPVTLNIDALGAVPVKQAAGVTDPSGDDCSAGRQVNLAYDGSVFRIVGGGSSASSGGGSVTVTGGVDPNEVWFPAAIVNPSFGSTALWTNSYNAGSVGGSLTLVAGVVLRANDFTQLQVNVPTKWAGNLTIKPFYTIGNSNNASGSVQLNYRTSCIAPGTTSMMSALAFNADTVTQPVFAAGDYTIGKRDTLSLDTTGCAPGNILIIQIRRPTFGTSAEAVYIFGMNVSLPYSI